MYTVIKDLEISACHRLNLNYASKCTQRHGHNWHIRVICESNEFCLLYTSDAADE